MFGLCREIFYLENKIMRIITKFVIYVKRTHKKAIIIITGSHFSDSTVPIYNSLYILQIDELYTFEVAKLMYQHNPEKLQSTFNNMFIKTNKVSKRFTEQSTSHNFYILHFRSNPLQRCIRNQGVKVWNFIPNEFISLPFKLFESKYKNHLISFALK